MKLNGISNIITDKDITLTENKNIGKSLSSVINDMDEKIDTLEQNIKFIYANGGVGGGSYGGSGAGSNKWQIRAILDNTTISNGSTVALSHGAGDYALRIYTSGGSGVYSVTYSYGGNLGRTITLSSDNAWTTTVNINLQDNGIISIIATDGSLTKEITGVNYIAVPYSYSNLKLYKDNGDSYAEGNVDIFVQDAQPEGIVIKSNYAIAVSGEFSYEWYYDNVQVASGIFPNNSGTISYRIPNSQIVNEAAATHFYDLIVYSKPESSVNTVTTKLSGSFNLIPSTLYLKLALPTAGEVFYTSPVEDPYMFSINKPIAIKARIYKGKNATNASGIIGWTKYEGENEIETNSISSRDGYDNTITISFSETGWNHVTFTYSLDGISGQPITRYFYCEKLETSYNWYIEGHEPTSENRRWYIAQETSADKKLYGISSTSIDPANIPLYIEKRSSDTTSIPILIEEYTNGDQLINIGIQYNDINNTKEPIIKLYDTANRSNDTITIYQDKIVFGNNIYTSEQSCDIFLHKERNYNAYDREKYHLLSIYISTAFYDALSNNRRYEISAYFDGVLDGTVISKDAASVHIVCMDLLPGNYAVNLIEFASWERSDNSRLLNDPDINWYWNSYKSRSDRGNTISAGETDILNALFDPNNNNAPTYTIENQLLKMNNIGFASTVALNANVPVMVVEVSDVVQYDGGETDIYHWMNTPYIDGVGTLAKVSVDIQRLQWSPGGSRLEEIFIPATFGDNNKFTLSLQGSSTMNNKSKNYTLSLESGPDVVQAGQAILFSPNFNREDTSTFLPEQKFTLKADVVDSSHSNNTAVGKFINDNNNWNFGGTFSGEANVIDHVKQCLEGFSMLMFMNVISKLPSGDFETSQYYLGIYNFNLGRDSYFNLGYCDLSQISINELESNSGAFKFCRVGGENSRGVNPVNGFIAAEIQDNSPYWDFSQYDDTVLFPINNTETGNFMFGDIVYAGGEQAIVQNRIKNFVKSVAGAGGYLFETIGKEFVDCGAKDGSNQIPYRVPNKVCDYKIQHRRYYEGTTPKWEPIPGDFGTLTQAAVEECIIDNPDEDRYAKLNYDSVVYYYTTCMTLGLTDSVQKNLNIKTWTATDANRCNMGLYFYDMDTCLGKNNMGSKTDYFAFSDFWKSNILKYDSSGTLIPDNDLVTEPARIVNNGCDIYRDCFFNDTNVQGYDTPSSYLFAIAKYAKAITGMETNVFPQRVYANWRKIGGPLENADKFVDTYFSSNFNGIPECLINLNYRNKYLYDYAENNISFEKASSFNGRGVEFVRDWLSGRLHILDAYFNLGQSSIQIYNNYTEPLHGIDISSNPDIYILSDIFTHTINGTISRNTGLTFTVNADDYAPLFVRQGNTFRWYLFEDSSINYETNVSVDGVQYTTFGGSQLWRSLDSINGFVNSMTDKSDTFVFDSSVLTFLNGTSGTHTGDWDITGPSLKSIRLVSPNYSGSLNITNQFPSLSTIDISNSSISLNINEQTLSSGGITTLNASNLKNSSQITIQNCNNLNSVNLNGASVTNCTISPTWTSLLDFSNIYAKTLKLTAKQSDPGTLTISSNSAIVTLECGNMESVSITSCPNLKSIKFTDSSNYPLESLNIDDCPSLETIEISAGENFTLLGITHCEKVNEITIKGPVSTFTNLKKFDINNTNISNIILITNGVIDDTTHSDGNFNLKLLCPNAGKVKLDNESYVRFDYTPVKTIQFTNIGGQPVYIKYSCRDCPSLTRIYGNVDVISGGAVFYNCKKFSVHGSELGSSSTWGGQAILSGGRVKHPVEIRPNDAATYGTFNDDGITNMSFTGVSNGSTMFTYTSCTIFDYYYILYRMPSLTNASSMFAYTQNNTWGRFSWTATADNSPNRNTFVNNTNITSATQMFRTSGNLQIRLFSPTNNGSIVTRDDGLFSPLIKLTGIIYPFYGYNCIIDRFVFQRSSGNYAITGIDRPYFIRIVSDINTISYNNASTLNNYISYLTRNNRTIYDAGDLTNFFNNLGNLSGNGINGLFDNVNFINFNTINGIPNAITRIIKSFRSSYGVGEINLSNYFSEGTKLTELYHSFSAYNIYNNEYAPTMNLTNSTFERFYPRSTDDYKGLIKLGSTTTFTNYQPSPDGAYLDTCFSGAVIKYIPEGFPYEIFSRLVNATMLQGLFQNTYVSDTPISNLKLPGNLFTNNVLLEDCKGMFFNIRIDYTISKTHDITYNSSGPVFTRYYGENETYDNFINCPNLTNVSYLFGSYDTYYEGGYNSTDSAFPHLTGSIPENLFWHGIFNIETVNVTGANTRQIENSNWVYNEESIPILKVTVLNTINDISYCFKHCNCSPYIKINPYLEDNPNYSPFIWIQKNGEWIQNPARNENRKTIIWQYDGEHRVSSEYNIEYLDNIDWLETLENNDFRYSEGTTTWVENNDVLPQSSRNYIAPPDLLRYCTSNASVQGLFMYSGLGGIDSTWQTPTSVNYNKYAYGIYGRICPYMFYPINKITSISEMFEGCKRLSYVYDKLLEVAFMIPDDLFTYAKEITKLQSAFAYTIQPNKLDMTNTFKPLTGILNVQSIFAYVYWSSEEGYNTRTKIYNVFSENRVDNVTDSFREMPDVNNQIHSYKPKQYVEFKDVFQNSASIKYNTPTYNNKAEFRNAFYGYNVNYVTFPIAGNRTLCDSNQNQNYTTTIY